MSKRSLIIAGAQVLALVGVASGLVALAVADQNPGIVVSFPEKVPVPSDNPQTPEKIDLGRKLYFDPRLSKNSKVSCNSCHNVLKGGDDGKPFSPGHEGKLGGRNSPTVFNAAYNSVQFWDGRAASLEDQAKGPMVNPVEMGMENHDVVIAVINKIPGYKADFEKAFGGGPINITRVVQAIAAYERTLVTPNSPYDKFVSGDKKALDASAQRGMKLVVSVGCTTCHNGSMFNGPILPQGQAIYQKFPMFPNSEYVKKYKFMDDTGRMEVTKAEKDRHFWRVPTWRNVAITAPYFHNGSVARLDEAVRVMASTQLNKNLKEGEVKDIVAFLKSLTGKAPQEKAPTLPPDAP